MKRRAYPIEVLSGALAVLVAPVVVAQVTPDPVLRPGAVQNDPALRPDQTNPAPVPAPTPGDSLAPLAPIFPGRN